MIAKKGGGSVAYRGRKKAKTSTILPITNAQGFIITSTGLIAGDHNDAYYLKPHLQTAFKSLKLLRSVFSGSYYTMPLRLLTRKLPAIIGSTMVWFPILMKTNVTTREPYKVVNDCSMEKFTRIALPEKELLPGSINSELCH